MGLCFFSLSCVNSVYSVKGLTHANLVGFKRPSKSGILSASHYFIFYLTVSAWIRFFSQDETSSTICSFNARFLLFLQSLSDILLWDRILQVDISYKFYDSVLVIWSFLSVICLFFPHQVLLHSTQVYILIF